MRRVAAGRVREGKRNEDHSGEEGSVRSRRALMLAALLIAAAWSASAAGLPPSESDARKIAEAMERRNEGDRARMEVTLLVIDASGRKRERKTRQIRKDFAGGRKTLLFFESPADVRDTGLLSVDYFDSTKSDDQWLYLPALHRSTRISTNDRSSSFMGTDITYADMTKMDTKAYDYSLVHQSQKVDGEDCWVIEARPRTDKERRETGYEKLHFWVHKTKLLPMQSKAWLNEGGKLKYVKFGQIEQVDGVWLARNVAVRVVRGDKVESQTLLRITRVRFGQADVTDDQFTERRLEQGL